MSKKIYIVKGVTGQYEDRTSWQVGAHFQKRRATAHMKKAQKRADELLLGWTCEKCGGGDTFRHKKCECSPLNEYDPYYYRDDKVVYFIAEVPFYPNKEN